MANILGTEKNFKSLSMKDLLHARDLYHYHLMNKPNVVGTAVGLYFIRKGDPYPEDERQRREKHGRRKMKDRTKKNKGERRLDNSEVRDYSWPCVHAFVCEWVDESKFGGRSGQLHPETMVPKTLYMPDGRMVPVCVTLVQQGRPSERLGNWQWPGGVFGGGMPILVRTQERERIATAGGLVTDGHKIYALTSRHVSGEKGETVYTLSRGQRIPIGRGSDLHLARLPFTEVYPEFAGRRTYVNLDVGLIEVDDANAWTSQYLDLGPVEAMADLNELNISTRLINAPVVAVGAASGRIEGRIKALFYRFKSVGGYDYVSDFLIAPRDFASKRGKPHTQPGDSGAVWHLVTHDEEVEPETDAEFYGKYRPLAIEWGGQVFLGKAPGQYTFGLATSLTTVCQALNVELVLERNVGALPYWGQVGHYSIGTFACSAIKNKKLKSFLSQYVEQISFSIADLDADTIRERIKAAREDDEQVIPLADVPDLVWKTFKSNPGGRDTQIYNGRTNGPEHPTHYADIDEPGPDGKSLLDLCLEDDANISVAVWQKFYDVMGHTKDKERGLLPFRVWQFFDRMVEFAGDPEGASRFLCAAGLLSHYVGDACQPLHGSVYANGYADQPKRVRHRRMDTGEVYYTDSHVGAGVHSTYETKMVDRYATDLVEGIRALEKMWKMELEPITSGKEAAKAIIHLMARAAKRLPPTDITDVYVAAGDKETVAVQDALWENFGAATIETMVDGANVLAAIWTGAWEAGGGQKIPADALKSIDAATLRKHYNDRKFVESLTLDKIEDELVV